METEKFSSAFGTKQKRTTYNINGKNKRIHIYVRDEHNDLIRQESKKQGLSISEYIINKVISFDVKGIPLMLDDIIRLIKKLSEKKVLKMSEDKEIVQALAKLTSIEPENDESFTETEDLDAVLKEFVSAKDDKKCNLTIKTKQLHIRTSEEVYELIKVQAAKHSMSMNDYIAFIATEFDIENISKKVDAIYDLLLKIDEKTDVK